MRPYTPAEYRRLVAEVAKDFPLKVIHQLPVKLSPDYRIGINFIYDGANHCWILDRDADGYKIFLDLKGDGDLSHAEALRFHKQDGIRRIDVPMKDGVFPWIARFELREEAGDGGSASVRINLDAKRSGKVVIDGHEIPFRLSGSSGRYDLLGDAVSFDRAGNGEYEDYRPEDHWVNLAGKTFAFRVDPQGAFLTLTESTPRADRQSLKNGSRVADVSLTDLEGKPHALRRNTADFTLVEFWSTHCGPCREEMPKLKTLYEKLPRSRFDIIGVTSDDSQEELKKYLGEFGIAWPECPESYEGAVHRLLRIEGEPTYFLFTKDGAIVDHWVGSGLAVAKIGAAVR